MSSRGKLVGAAPKPSIYTPRPLPQDAEDIPSYLQEELLNISKYLNDIIQGRVYVPQSELPERLFEGMTVYYIGAVPDTDIISKGLWLYDGNSWSKVI